MKRKDLKIEKNLFGDYEVVGPITMSFYNNAYYLVFYLHKTKPITNQSKKKEHCRHHQSNYRSFFTIFISIIFGRF